MMGAGSVWIEEEGDPYGGDRAEFASVLDLLETGMTNLTSQLRALLHAPVADR